MRLFHRRPSASQPGGGSVYAPYITSLLDYEQARKTALEAKATAVITTSGTLVALLFGLVAVVTGAKTFVLPVASHGWLVAAIVLFVVAVGLAIVASIIPVPYGTVTFDPSNLSRVWRTPPDVASRHVAEAQLSQIALAKKKNSRKAWMVLLSGLLELSALVMLAVAVIVIVGTRQGH